MMTTCKDCLHYDICTFHITGNENERCCHFKNKADVVEVVRCKDCKHWEKRGTDPILECEFGDCHCLQWENCEFYYETCGDDFCSCGERKEGAE